MDAVEKQPESALEANVVALMQDLREAGYPMMMNRRKAAELLGVNANSIWKQTRKGAIPATRYGEGRGVLRYLLRDLATYIVSNRCAVEEEATNE